MKKFTGLPAATASRSVYEPPKKTIFPCQGGAENKMRGRKPKPDEMKAKSHKKKFNRVDFGVFNEDDARGISFEGLPAAVRRRAESVLEMLRQRVVLNSCDAESFSRYIQHLRIAYQADEILKAEGVTTIDEDGLTRKHPALQIHRDNSLAALRFEEQFGLTPSARMRLRSVEAAEADRESAEFEDFLNDRE